MTAPTRTGPDLRVIVGVVAAVAVIAVLAIFALGSGDDDDGSAASGAPEYGATDAVGTALPPLPDGTADPAVGQPAPRLVSESVEGAVTVDPDALDQPVMLVFLAHWCPHCQRELPRLVELQEAGAFDDIRTVGVLIATDPARPNYPPSSWLDEEGWAGDRLFDDRDGTAATAYGVSSFPFVVFLDEDGTVAQRLAGEQAEGVIAAAVEAVAS